MVAKKQRNIKFDPLKSLPSIPVNDEPLLTPIAHLEAVKARILATRLDVVEKSTIIHHLTQISRKLELESLANLYTGQKPVTVSHTEPKYTGFVGKNLEILRILEISAAVAPTKLPVLILGETGTGKELIAQVIHINSGLKNLVTVNCGALPPTLIESELFGHEKGAFTGAIRDRKGKFELADGGTIFLDEIGELAPELQVKLLRALQFGEIQRIGSDKFIKVNVRLIAATNKNLHQEVAEGKFRDDLYFRLRVCQLSLPPLRVRRDEIKPLLDFYLKKFALENNRTIPALSVSLSKFLLSDYYFPGNIRELENICHLLVILASNGRIDFPDLPPGFFQDHGDSGNYFPDVSMNINGPTEKLNGAQQKFFETLLRKHNGKVANAVNESGYSRARFYQLLKKFQLKPENFRKR